MTVETRGALSGQWGSPRHDWYTVIGCVPGKYTVNTYASEAAGTR